MKTKTIIILCLAMVIAFASMAVAKDKKSKEDYTKHPGYVDFDVLDIFGDEEAKIEVLLKQPMLDLVSKFAKNEDPDLYNVLGKLALVRVHVFEVSRDLEEKFNAESSKTIKSLDKKGWERVVRVREDDELVYVYLKPSKDYEFIQGIVVLAVESSDEAVFVNIAGDIHPDDINQLGDYLGIDELDGIHIKNHDDDDD